MCDKCETNETKPSDIEKEMNDSFLLNRKVFLYEGVSDSSAKDIIRRLMYLDSKSNEDITLFINSPGGVVTDGYAILDCMDAIKSDVITVVTGQAASMGAMIQSHGTKGKRYAWKNARIMIHQPSISGNMYCVTSDMQIQADEIEKMRTKLNKMLSNVTGQTLKKIEKDTDRDYYLSADEALKYGLIDFVENKL